MAEAYPDLKANQNMMQLSEELTTTENKVAFSRQAYNDSVLAYNNKREVFPNNIVAGMFGFERPRFSRSMSRRSARLPRCSSDPSGRTPMNFFEAQERARKSSRLLVCGSYSRCWASLW